MSDVSCHLRIWATHMVGRRQACIPSSPFIVHMVVRHRVWHQIITLRHDTRSDYSRRGMPSSPLSSSQGRDMSGEACHHCLWEKHMVRLRRVWHAIIYLGHHKQLKKVECFMLLSSLDFTHGRTTSGMACLHVPYEENPVRRHRARHSIIALEQHTRLATSCIACYH